MSVYYLWDEERKKRLNQAGVDDTASYIPALLRMLGVTGEPLKPEELDRLKETDVLLAVRKHLPRLSCTVITFAKDQDPMDTFEKKMYGIFRCCSPDAQRVPVFAPVYTGERAENQEMGQILAQITTEDGEIVPAWIQRGNQHDFTFDLPASVWYSEDGFVQKGGINGFQAARIPDMRPLPLSYDTSVPYNDILCRQLQEILSSAGVPALDYLPLMPGEQAADFALHFSGDDDATSERINRTAVYYMESLGIPYHINVMPVDEERFIIDKKAYQELKGHGCEFALHTNFYEAAYTEENQKKQAELYHKIFGEEPITNVNHCLIRDGSTAEVLGWLEGLGIIADNGKEGEVDPDDVNAFNLCGYAFGTTYPRYTCSDAASGNRIIETMEIPMTYYEPRYDGNRYPQKEPICRHLDESAANGRISQFFMHPHYFNEEFGNMEAVHGALELITRHCLEKGYQVCYTTTNQLAGFWQNRSKSQITETAPGEYKLRAACPLAIRLPKRIRKVKCLEMKIKVEEKERRERTEYLAVIPKAGEYTLFMSE